MDVGRKTLVAAGHVTTQNMVCKKICWAEGVAECFDRCCGKLCEFRNLKQSLKTIRFIGILQMKNVTLFLPSQNIEDSDRVHPDLTKIYPPQGGGGVEGGIKIERPNLSETSGSVF